MRLVSYGLSRGLMLPPHKLEELLCTVVCWGWTSAHGFFTGKKHPTSCAGGWAEKVAWVLKACVWCYTWDQMKS